LGTHTGNYFARPVYAAANERLTEHARLLEFTNIRVILSKKNKNSRVTPQKKNNFYSPPIEILFQQIYKRKASNNTKLRTSNLYF